MQPDNTSSRKIGIVIAVFIVAILAWVGLAIFQGMQFRAVSTNPSTKDVTTAAPFFKVNFNRELSKNGLSVTSTPDVIASYSVSGKTLSITFKQALKNNTTYTITIASISDTAGKKLTNLKFSFKAKALTTGQLPNDQVQAQLQQQTQYKQNVQGDPLIQLLPFVGAGSSYYIAYTVESTPTGPHATVTITAPTEEGQQSAINWIKGQGIDPAKYTIVYKTGPVSAN